MTAKMNETRINSIDYDEVDRLIAAGRYERSKVFHAVLHRIGARIARLFDLHAAVQKTVGFEPTIKPASKH